MTRFACVADPTTTAQLLNLSSRLEGSTLAACVAENTSGADAAGVVAASDLATLLRDHDDDFDAIVIAAGTSDELSLAAGSGKRLLVSMPVLAKLPDHTLDEILPSDSIVIQPLRFLPTVAVIKERVSAGHLGQPGLVRIHRWGPEPNGTDEAVADIDLACWLFDDEPDHVFAVQAPGETGWQVHLGFRSGGMAMLDTATLPDGDDYYSISLIGSRGAAYADDHHNMQLVYRGGSAAARKTEQGQLAWLRQLQACVDHVRDGTPPTPTRDDALRALRVRSAALTCCQN